jgi:hypothetical protein
MEVTSSKTLHTDLCPQWLDLAAINGSQNALVGLSGYQGCGTVTALRFTWRTNCNPDCLVCDVYRLQASQNLQPIQLADTMG